MNMKISNNSLLTSLMLLSILGVILPAQAMKKGNIVPISEILDTLDNPHKTPYIVTPEWKQEQIAKSEFTQTSAKPWITTSVTFEGPNGSTTYKNPNQK